MHIRSSAAPIGFDPKGALAEEWRRKLQILEDRNLAARLEREAERRAHHAELQAMREQYHRHRSNEGEVRQGLAP